MEILPSFIVSFFASLGVAFVIYWGFQWLSSHFLRKRKVGDSECWLLSRWNCFRLVVRNIPGNHALLSTKWRAWLSAIIPAQPGCSVKTFVDTDLNSGERIYLPAGVDLPLICFRFDENHGKIKLIMMDKLGNPISSYDLNGTDSIRVEYHVAVKHWFVFKHDVNRIIFIPLSKAQIKGKLIDYVRDYYLAKQKVCISEGSETKVKVYKLGEKITTQL